MWLPNDASSYTTTSAARAIIAISVPSNGHTAFRHPIN
jgi:hypothetical protein